MKVYALLHYYKTEEGYKSLLVSIHATRTGVEMEKIAQKAEYDSDRYWLEQEHWFDIREMELLG